MRKDIPDAIKGVRVKFLALENLLLAHESEDLLEFPAADAQIIGHFHPKSSHTISRRKVTGKCFISATNILLMPAYGKYTGGLYIKHKAFASMLNTEANSGYAIYLLFHQKIYLF